MPQTLYTSRRVPVTLGKELGRGGEGTVYALANAGGQVAKLLKPEALADGMPAKLAFMTAHGDPKLLQYLAWPQETLHAKPGGPTVGFLMPRVNDAEPIHMLYGPAHRKADYPNAAWDFLVFTARNIAAAFDTLHDHGHVIGDVNHGNVLVARDSRVVLIDCDSLQINAKGTMYLCKVGVSYFTPPELQVGASFRTKPRTPNHDNFGLALFVFHLLFGGRHPYAGVPLRADVGEELEADIANFRYAYARDAQARGAKPPPHSIPISILPDSTEAMFTLAFTERGAQGARPTAAQWVTELDGLRQRLARCSSSTMHVYPKHLSTCPWCALERSGVVYFLEQGARTQAPNREFVLSEIWAHVEAVPPPKGLVKPAPPMSGVTPKPLPPAATVGAWAKFLRLLVVIAAVYGCFTSPGGFILWVGAAAFVYWILGARGEALSKERLARETRLRAVKEDLEEAFSKAQRDAGEAVFAAKRQEYVRVRAEYMLLDDSLQTALNELQNTARSRQLAAHLANCFIDKADIAKVGPSKKAALRSFGIETAADVTHPRVVMVPGFGDRLTANMVAWRRECEQSFRFNPARAVTAADRAQVTRKFAQRKTALEAQLREAPYELRKLAAQLTAEANAAQATLNALSYDVAEAQADMTVF